jgi:hypothetical protein
MKRRVERAGFLSQRTVFTDSAGGKVNLCAVKWHCMVVVSYSIYFKKKALNPTVHKKRGRNIRDSILDYRRQRSGKEFIPLIY